MSSLYGEHLKLSIFGQSHGPSIGMTLDGIPAGLPVEHDVVNTFMARRAPGTASHATTRKEPDKVEFLSGIVNGYTCGAPICAVIQNTNTRSGDYSNLRDCPRPGHADYTAQVKYGGFQDVAGGGHFSGRLTAPLCIAGALCMQWLNARGIRIAAHLYSVADIQDQPFSAVAPQIDQVNGDFPVIDHNVGKRMLAAIADAKTDGDSVGGVIECAVTGLPAGLGDPMFDGMENRIAHIIFGIPAVKGIEFGNGFASTTLLGSQNNDAFCFDSDKIRTVTNNSGGILGGITTGKPLIFRVAIKPTPSIAKTQQSISLSAKSGKELQTVGRHDPCIAPRAVPVVEAAAAIAIFDALLCND